VIRRKRTHYFPETSLVGIAVLWIAFARIVAVERLRLLLRNWSLLLILVILIRDIPEHFFVVAFVVLRLVIQRLQASEVLLKFANQVKDTANEGRLM
jgi:hypothetical protein